jgi:hypothetical protein
MALTFVGNARFASLLRKQFHEKQAMLSSDWLIISRESQEIFCIVNSSCSFSNFDFSLNSETQTVVFIKQSSKNFLHQTSSPKNAHCQCWRWEMRCIMKSCLFSKVLQVNLEYFISQVFISVLGNHYMFSIWKNVHFAFHGIYAMFKPLCNFMQTKTFQVTWSAWVIGVIKIEQRQPVL